MADPDVSGVRQAAGAAVVAVSTRLRWSRAVDAAVWTVAASGCALSYDSIQSAAEAHVDFEPLSYLLPLATDGAAIAAAARYVLDRRQGLSGRGWQGLAWSAIGASIALNVVGRDLVDALWHVAGPAVLAAVTELYAHRAARQFVAERHQAHELGAEVGIPRRLWVTAPGSSWRLWLWMARTGTRDAVAARIALGRYAAAREALRAACAGRAYQRMRRVAARQLRAATLAPASVLDVLGWSGGGAAGRRASGIAGPAGHRSCRWSRPDHGRGGRLNRHTPGRPDRVGRGRRVDGSSARPVPGSCAGSGRRAGSPRQGRDDSWVAPDRHDSWVEPVRPGPRGSVGSGRDLVRVEAGCLDRPGPGPGRGPGAGRTGGSPA